MKPFLRVVSISDLHIGHYKIQPMVALDNIRKFLYPQLTEDLDILFIGGDFFHTLLNLNSLSAYVALVVIQELLDLSIKFNFRIRVLKGTSDHDREQNKFFLVSPEKYPEVKVISNMLVEHIEDLDIWILYIPDDLPYNNGQAEAIRKIKELGIKKVDICVLHGYCENEIPKNVPIKPYNVYNVDVLMKYVRGPILKGHIHIKSIYKTCVNNGAFFRGNHGEEGSKGFFSIDIFKDMTFKYKFIENEDTYLFKTIPIPSENIITNFKKAMTKIMDEVKETTPKPLYVRILCEKSTKAKFNPHEFDFPYPVRYSYKYTDTEISAKDVEEIVSNVQELPKITKDSLSSLLSMHMSNKLSAEVIASIMKAEM